MRGQDLTGVRALPLFATMDEITFDRLAPASFLQLFPTGVQLISEGESADFLHIVVDGSVELFASGNGRETTVAILPPVTAFILAAVLKDIREHRHEYENEEWIKQQLAGRREAGFPQAFTEGKSGERRTNCK